MLYRLGAKGKDVVSIGASAGGGLAFGMALKLIDAGMGDKVSRVAALAPVTVDLHNNYYSYEEHAYKTVNMKDTMVVLLDVCNRPILSQD